MTERFVLEITMGNDAMQTHYDVARALKDMAYRVSNGGEGGIILDDNGQRVGEWRFEKDYLNV